MKKATFDVMLGKKTRCLFKKHAPKTTILCANLPVGVAKSTQALRTAFGNYGLNIEDFCNYFNTNSILLWEKQLLIPIVIFISAAKTYFVEYKLPTVYSLYDRMFKFKTCRKTYFTQSTNRKLLVATAYKIAAISSQSTNPMILRKYTRQILGSFSSYNLFSYFRRIKVKVNFRRKLKPNTDTNRKNKGTKDKNKK